MTLAPMIEAQLGAGPAGPVASARVAAETPLGPSRTGSVVLNLGEGFGAVIVYTAAQLAGEEIEIRLAPEPWAGRHSDVRPRHLATGVQYAAVFDGLPQGVYEVRLRRRMAEGADTLVVAGGAITRHHLGSSDSAV